MNRVIPQVVQSLTSQRIVALIDTSFWQASNPRYPPIKPFECQAAANMGIQGGYMKSTIGVNRVDPEWKRTYECWGSLNKKRGNYHWFIAGETGESQARWYLFQSSEMRGELPPAADCEVSGLYAREIWAFCKEIHRVDGRWPVIYTGPWAWQNVRDGWTLEEIIPTTYKALIAKYCDLWQAQYPTDDDGRKIQTLSGIHAWSKIGKTATIHQYSVRQGWGRTFGSKGSLSMDLDLAEAGWFSKWPWPSQQPTPTPSAPTVSGWQLKAGAKALNIRERPYKSDPAPKIVGVIYAGQIVQIEEERDGSWAQLSSGAGWVNTSYLVEL